MPTVIRPKIIFAEMRAAGVRGLLVYCSDYKCSHWTAISGDKWPDDVRLSDLEPRFTCQGVGAVLFFQSAGNRDILTNRFSYSSLIA